MKEFQFSGCFFDFSVYLFYLIFFLNILKQKMNHKKKLTNKLFLII